jgi:hypothetical protein
MGTPWNREALYKEVWAEPLTSLGKRYGVSGNAIAKVCKKLKIPVPGRGYWAKKANGYSVRQVVLLSLKNAPVLWQPTPTPIPEKTPMDPDFELIEKRLINGEFSPSSLDPKVRPLIEAARKSMHSRRKSYTGGNNFCFRSEAFDLRVSEACLDRAIDLIVAIMSVAGRIDASVQTKKPQNAWDKTVTVFAYGGGEAPFCIRERIRMVKIPQSPASNFGTSRKHEPTGVLAIEILGYTEKLKALWQDKPNRPVEAQIPEIIAGLIKVAILDRRREEE